MTSIQHLLRQQSEPITIPPNSTVGIYRIENGEELEKVIKLKHIGDAEKLLSDLSTDDAWFMYVKPDGQRATIIAMSEKMREALCLQQ